jgi:hypothetical protein
MVNPSSFELDPPAGTAASTASTVSTLSYF